jgi:hypothetical protein
MGYVRCKLSHVSCRFWKKCRATAASPSGRQRQTSQCSLRQAHLCTLLCLHGKGQLPAELLHSDVCDRAFLPRRYTPNVCATVRGGVGELTRSVN